MSLSENKRQGIVIQGCNGKTWSHNHTQEAKEDDSFEGKMRKVIKVILKQLLLTRIYNKDSISPR
jgi:hypothetical protein